MYSIVLVLQNLACLLNLNPLFLVNASWTSLLKAEVFSIVCSGESRLLMVGLLVALLLC